MNVVIGSRMKKHWALKIRLAAVTLGLQSKEQLLWDQERHDCQSVQIDYFR
jgi:hypothetical protein